MTFDELEKTYQEAIDKALERPSEGLALLIDRAHTLAEMSVQGLATYDYDWVSDNSGVVEEQAAVVADNLDVEALFTVLASDPSIGRVTPNLYFDMDEEEADGLNTATMAYWALSEVLWRGVVEMEAGRWR